MGALAKVWEDAGVKPEVATWFVYTGFVITAVSLVYQFVVGRPFAMDFSAADWKPNQDGSGYVLHIKRSQHKKGQSPIATTYARSSGRREEVIADVHVENGDVLVGASQPFEGSVVVK